MDQDNQPDEIMDSSGHTRSFVQTVQAVLPNLDRWSQVTEEEVSLVTEMTRRNELSGGTPVVREFEQHWRDWTGSKYAVSVTNGAAALYSAYFGIGVGPGDEVICPVNTWISSIAPALLLGARPVFCDIDPDTLLMDPADVQAKITPNTRCICAVHLWGNVCDMDALLALADKHGIPIVEDCSHAHGAKYKGKICGALGRAGCWSMQGSKPVSAGEGGVLATDEVDVFERACLVGQVNRIVGIDLVSSRYEGLQPLGLGMKFRSHPLGIGIASVQLKRLAELNRRRAAYIQEIETGLAGIPGLRPVTVHPGAERGGFYGFPILHDAEAMGMTLDEFLAGVNAQGLAASKTGYPNLHTLDIFAKGFDIFTRNRGPLCTSEGYRGYERGDFPKAELAVQQTVFLPVLSDPIPDAAATILDIMRKAATRSVS